MTSRSLASQPIIETEELESALSQVDSQWCQLTANGTKFIALKVGDDGSSYLYQAFADSGECVGWVLNLASVELPWAPDAAAVPSELHSFAEPQIRYAVAGRRAPTASFMDVATALMVPKRALISPRRKWDGSGLGDDLRIKEISAEDHHWYDEELRRIALRKPKCLFKLMFTHHHVESVREAEWRAMLGVMARLARDTRGILYRLDGDELMMRDFGSRR